MWYSFLLEVEYTPGPQRGWEGLGSRKLKKKITLSGVEPAIASRSKFVEILLFPLTSDAPELFPLQFF
jgi:hypothetical protein